MEQNIQNNDGNALIKKMGLILAVFVFILPIFFVPFGSINLYVAKITFLATGLVAMFAVFLSAVLSNGNIEMPKVKYLIPIAVFALVALLSSAFSGAIGLSIAGYAFDLGTSGSLVMLVFLMFVTIMATKSTQTVGKVILAFIYSAIVLALYTILGSVGGSIIPSFISSKMPLFISGSLTDTAVILGGAIILSLGALNMSEISKRMKYVLYALIALSLVIIGASNFTPVIIILGLLSMIFFVYILSWSVGAHGSEGSSGSNARKISISSIIVLIISVLLLLGGSGISGYISRVIKVQATEVRPNFQTTMDLTVASWKENPAFGIGPNRFTKFWSLNKPLAINQTQFWNSDFYTGSGFVPTVAITTGLLGILSLLAFIGMYLVSGVKAIFAQVGDNRYRYFAVSTFLASLYLWVMLFLYTPNITVMALTFIFTGLFTSVLVLQGVSSSWKINIFSNPRTNFLSVLSIVVLLILSVAGGYFVWERSLAAIIFQNGIANYQKTGNLEVAKSSVTKSINMVSNDLYWRGLTEISLFSLGRILGGITNQNQITEPIRAEIQLLIANSVDSAKKAVEEDKSNFQNWFALGRVYELLASNGIEGSLGNAREAYNEAILRSPNNPSVPLAIARLDALAGNIAGARENIRKALELKNNYTDAYFTLAQLEAAANNIPGAIRSVEAATVIDPNNSGLYFQIGLLKYNQRDFAGAISALEKAVTLVPDYANAKYFLGLSYYQIGRKENALKQFEDIDMTNPDNAEVDLIITNIKSGKELFSDAKPPVDENPEKRNELPIKEEN